MNKFIKSTLILIVGGFITKLLGMIIKIVTTRLLGTTGIGIYMLVTPTFSLLIAISQLGMQSSISKLVADEKNNNTNLLFSAFPISFLINTLIFIFLFFSSKYIALNLLHEIRCSYTLFSIAFVLPFISISSILRGYFFGKQKMIPHVLSNILEDIVRLIALIIGIPIFLSKGLEYAICFVLLSNIFSEISSIIIFILFLPKKIKLKKEDLKPNLKSIESILSISLPTTASRIIGSVGYFLEPIILTYVLLKTGYSNNFIVNEYGIINGYVLPLLLLPSFFSNAISQALLPIISLNYAKGNILYVKNKIKQAIFFSLIIGIPITLVFMFTPNIPLKLVYNTNEGINYIKLLSPIFLLLYIQSPLVTSLHAMNKAKDTLIATTIGMIIRTSLLFVLSFLNIGLYGLIFATMSNIIIVTIINLIKVLNALKK